MISFWYLSDPGWPAPNLILLNNALRQTGWDGESLVEQSWKAALLARLETMAWGQIAQDVSPFIERGEEAGLLVLDNFRALIPERVRWGIRFYILDCSIVQYPYCLYHLNKPRRNDG